MSSFEAIAIGLGLSCAVTVLMFILVFTAMRHWAAFFGIPLTHAARVAQIKRKIEAERLAQELEKGDEK